jgi:hypothetical protein
VWLFQWRAFRQVDGYNVYVDGEKVNETLVTDPFYEIPASLNAIRFKVVDVVDGQEEFESREISSPGLVNMYFLQMGGNGEIYKSPMDEFVDNDQVTTMASSTQRDIKIDSVNRWIFGSRGNATSGGNATRVQRTNLDNPSGMVQQSASGNWHPGCDVDPENNHVYVCDTNERINRAVSGGSTINSVVLFSSRQSGVSGRPNRCAVDVHRNRIVAQLGSETSRMSIFPLDDPTDNDLVLYETAVVGLSMDKKRAKVMFRGHTNEGHDANDILRMDYDGDNFEVFYSHNEDVRWIVWNWGMPDDIFFATETGLYRLTIEEKQLTQIFATSVIQMFDFEHLDGVVLNYT